MQIQTYEGVVKNGRIQLKSNVRLPENVKVYVIIPEMEAKNVAYIYSPRLANPKQIADFKKEVIEEASDADL